MILDHTQTLSIDEVMGWIPSKDRSRIWKCTVLNLGLINEVKAVIFEINKLVMIPHTQGKSW